jgi:glucose/arabinose dehydrogenase
VALAPLATGLPSSPVAVAHAGDVRLFLALKDGRIVIHDGVQVLPVPFLDLRHLVRSDGLEQGLLGVAFHPGYPAAPFVYVDYTDLAGDTVVARYEVDPGDPDRALPGSALTLLAIDQPSEIHNGGQLQFGPDGFLYIGMGDGGPHNDPDCHAQRTDSLLGKILRIDVDGGDGVRPYGIPADNPFAGPGDPPDEIWALGLRNPWRFSFDRLTGDLYVADVGQAQREEVNRQPAGAAGGRNYGWKRMEGTLCLGEPAGCPSAPPACGSPALTPPILEFDHSGGHCAVIGGFVYRGAGIPGLAGRYLYGDLCTGDLWAAAEEGGLWPSRLLPVALPLVTSFGEDAAGEPILTSLGGDVYRLIAAPPPGPCAESATALCLLGGRFRVEAAWEDHAGGRGPGRAERFTDESGWFWFFNPLNTELVVKVRDACAPPFERFWFFAAGLTDVGVTLTVADTETREVRRYERPRGQAFAPVQDTQAFDTCP